jgi:hypothetical protein
MLLGAEHASERRLRDHRRSVPPGAGYLQMRARAIDAGLIRDVANIEIRWSSMRWAGSRATICPRRISLSFEGSVVSVMGASIHPVNDEMQPVAHLIAARPLPITRPMMGSLTAPACMAYWPGPRSATKP